MASLSYSYIVEVAQLVRASEPKTCDSVLNNSSIYATVKLKVLGSSPSFDVFT